MDHVQLIKSIRNRELKPVYVLHGDEPYFIDQVLEVMEKELVDESTADFNLHILYGGETNTDDIVGISKSFPMMGDLQVVIVKEAQELAEFKRGTDAVAMEKYVAQPQSSTVLIIAHMHKTMDKRRKLWKALESSSHVEILTSSRMEDHQVPGWIERFVKSLGLSIDQDSAFLLSEYLGNDLSKISNEVNKLKLILPQGASIDAAVIEKHIGISKEFNVFELQKALAVKDVVKSNRIGNYFAANQKDNPIQMVIPVLYTFFSKVLLVHYVSPSELGSVLRVPRHIIPEYRQAASNYPISKVLRIIGYLRECDRSVKGGDGTSVPIEFQIRELLFKILH